MESMVESLYYYSCEKPNSLFVVDDKGNEYTYYKAWKTVLKLAKFFISEKKIKKGDHIMVRCNQEAIFIFVDLACELIGAVFIPVEDNASIDRIEQIFDEVNADLLIGIESDMYSNIGVSYSNLKDYDEELDSFSFPEAKQLAEILYTTGTTGKSKGIMITNEANIALAENIIYGVGMKEDNVELIPVPISHSHGIRCCYANLLKGGTIILCDGIIRINQIFDMIDKYNVTSLDVSPSAVQLMIKLSRGQFWSKCKNFLYIQIGTAVLSEELKRDMINNLEGVHLYNFYGSTESGRSCVLDFSIEKEKAKCIGRPTVNSHIIFVDDSRRKISADEKNPGLLASKGKMNMMGYWNNMKLTDEILVDGYVYTNDLGYIDDDGYIYIIGRKDDVINFNGIKISPEEVEDIAIKYNGVVDAICVPKKDDLFGQVPYLLIVVEDRESFEIKSLFGFLSDHLDGNKLPKQIDFIDSIPRTYNGKKLRKEFYDK